MTRLVVVLGLVVAAGGALTACGDPEAGGARGTGVLDSGAGQTDAGGGQGGAAGQAGAGAGGDDGGTPGPTCDEVVCHALATCDDTSGSAVCACIDGYGGDGTASCEDIDECATGTHRCDPAATCTNTEGGHDCECPAGTTGDGTTCGDFDECSDPTANDCHANADCTDEPGTFSCACKDGFTGDGVSCADVNECEDGTDGCPAGTTCVNNSGGFDCECSAGFVLYMGQCTDKCEVARSEGQCDAIASCQIVANEASCSCPATHFDQNGDGSLCIMNASCSATCTDPNATCTVLSPTQVKCECPPGRFTDPNGNGSNCVDVNECTLNTDGCHANATCANTVGGYTCQCNGGYTGNGFTCTNVNECTAGTDNCDPNATCTDTPGSFTCACKAGYSGSGLSCADVNECTTGGHNCNVNANCTNTPGSFTCACKPGYTGNGTTTCTDVNECTAGTANCHANATCTNTTGSFTCACNAGYVGNGTTVCNNLNECTTGQHNCSPNATCTDANPPQRFTCACNLGYTGNGQTCTFQFCDLNGTWGLRGRITTSWQNLRANVFPNPIILQAGTFTADVWEKRRLTYDGTTLTTEIQMCGATYPDAHNPTLNETYGAYIPFGIWDTLSYQAPFNITITNAKAATPFNVPTRGYLFGVRLPNADGTGAWPGPGALTADCATGSPPCWSNDDADGWAGGTQWSRPPTQTSTIYSQAYDYPPSAPQVIVSRRVACSHVASRSLYSMAGTVNSCTQITGTMSVGSIDQRLHSCRRAYNNNSEVNCATNRDVPTGNTLPACSASDAQGLDASIEDVVESVDAATFSMVKVANNADCAAVRATVYP